MKLDSFKCDRCGSTFKNRQSLQGVSGRCMEREWDLCDKCLSEFHYFMGDVYIDEKWEEDEEFKIICEHPCIVTLNPNFKTEPLNDFFLDFKEKL